MTDRNNKKPLLLKIYLSSKCCFKKNTTEVQSWPSKLCKSYRSRLHWSKVLRFPSRSVSTYSVLMLCQFCSVVVHKINCRNLSSNTMHYYNIMKQNSSHVNQKVVEQWKPSICWAAVLGQMNENGLNLSLVGERVLVHFGEEFGIETRKTEGSVYLGGVQ